MRKRSGPSLSDCAARIPFLTRRFLSRYLYIACLILALIQGNLNGFAEEPTADPMAPLQISLQVDREEILPGQSFWVVAHVQVEKGWHTYGENPGDAGFPLEVTWHLPEGFSATSIQWPTPEQFSTGGLLGSGYSNPFSLIFQITPPDQLENTHPTLEAAFSWLACSDHHCLPGTTTAVAAPFPSPQEAAIAVALAQSQLPKTIREPEMNEQGGQPGTDPGASFLEQNGILMILLLAFTGGLILNCMPCVLPIVSLKILSFVKLAGEQRSKTFKHGAAFAAGVMTSFWVLASILLLMQTYGRSLGWGFQLQEPLFVALLAAVLWILSLSLFGVFEAGTSISSLAGEAQSQAVLRARSGYLASFLNGTLATAVATPCTGPFLGPVIGFATTATPSQSLLTFSFLGLGMAAPYLLLAAFPNLTSFLPKPGKWMDTFKQLMGFFMVATVLWLAWIFAAETSHLGLLLLLVSFFLLALAGWIYGKWGTPVQKPKIRWVGYGAALICGLAAVYTLTLAASALEQETTVASAEHVMNADGWEPFSEERIANLQAQGIPVFVDFTAKWCLICQVNHTVLMSQEVQDRFAASPVVKMQADWTKKDEKITRALQKFGRNAVPLYVLYPGNSSETPKILPQILTPQIVIDSLELE